MTEFTVLMQVAAHAAVQEAMAGAMTFAYSMQADPIAHCMPTENRRMVPMFNSTSETFVPMDYWVCHVNISVAAYGWSKRHKCCHLILKLDRVVQTWYEGIASMQHT